MPRIYISWPGNPEMFRLRQHHHGNAHQACKMLRGLQDHFPHVTWLNWLEEPLWSQVTPGDWLICHPDWQGSWDKVARPFLERGGRLGLVMNDPIYNYAWAHGAYNLHGYHGFDHMGLFYSEQLPNPSATHMAKQILQAEFTLCHSNSVVMEKWRSGSPEVFCAKSVLEGAKNFRLVKAPCDTEALFREYHHPYPVGKKQGQLLVYGRADWRKVPQHVHEALFPGDWVPFEPINWFVRESYLDHLESCRVAVSASLQEAFPYFGLECLSKGLLFMGSEDWYDGFGYEALIWRHGRSPNDRYARLTNKAKLKFLQSDSMELTRMYQDVQSKFREDVEHTWEFFNGVMASYIKGFAPDGTPV